MFSTVTGKRQITIPAKIAAVLGIEAGTQVEWASDVDHRTLTLTIKPGKKQLLDRVREIGQRYRNDGENAAEILERERERDESEHMRELAVAEQPEPYGNSRRKAKA